MAARRRKAATTRLEPGEHSIDRNTPTKRVINGREVIALNWRLRLPDGRLLPERRTEGRTAAEVRRRARLTAQQLLTNYGTKASWTPSDPVERYLDEVSAQEILQAGLRPDTVKKYQLLLKFLRAELLGHSIASAETPEVLIAAIQKIAAQRGYETARQLQHFHTRYINQPMQRHRLVADKPIANMNLNLRLHAPELTGPKRGGVALSAEEHERVLRYLLAVDPGRDVPERQRGRWSYETRRAKQLCVIDLTLLQMGTGLRLNEALGLRWCDVSYGSDQVMRLSITISKTGIPRQPAVLDERIQHRLEERWRRAASDTEYIIGAPSNPAKRWGKGGNGGATQAVAALYQQIAQDVEVRHLDFQRSHLWRTTINKRLEEAGVPQSDRSAQLGHDEQTNQKSYTAKADVAGLVRAYRAQDRPDLA